MKNVRAISPRAERRQHSGQMSSRRQLLNNGPRVGDERRPSLRSQGSWEEVGGGRGKGSAGSCTSQDSLDL